MDWILIEWDEDGDPYRVFGPYDSKYYAEDDIKRLPTPRDRTTPVPRPIYDEALDTTHRPGLMYVVTVVLLFVAFFLSFFI